MSSYEVLIYFHPTQWLNGSKATPEVLFPANESANPPLGEVATMAADATRRSRILAITFSWLMLASAFAAMMPVASAAAPTNLTVTNAKVTVGGTDANGQLLKLGDTFALTVSATADVSGCTVPVSASAPSFLIVDADLSTVGGATTWGHRASMTPQSGTIWTGTVTFAAITINQTGTANGESRSIPLKVRAACHNSGQAATDEPTTDLTTATSNAFRPDAVRPTVTGVASAVSGTTVGIGQAFKVQFTAASSDIQTSTITLTQFTNACGAPCNLAAGAPQNIASMTLTDTNVVAPAGSVALVDAAGNTNTVPITVQSGHTIDAKRPSAPTVSATAGAGPKLTVTATTTETDLSKYVTTVTPGSGSAVTLDCPGTSGALTCTGTVVQNGQSSFDITGVATRTVYTVGVSARDLVGNAAPTTPTASATTAAQPSATVTVTVTGSGGAGSTFSIGATATDVARVTADLSQLLASSTTQTFVPGSTLGPFTVSSAAVTRSDTAAPSFTMEACTPEPCSPTGSPADVTSVQYVVNGAAPTATSPFDSLAPAVHSISATAKSGGVVELTWINATSDIFSWDIEVTPAPSASSPTSAPVRPICTLGGQCKVTLTADHVVTGTTYSFRLRGTDVKGNVGAYSSPTTATPSLSPVSISIDALPVEPQTTRATITGTYGAGGASATLEVAIQKVCPGGAATCAEPTGWWDGSGNAAGDFTATPTYLAATSTSASAWSFAGFAGATDLPSGSYKFQARIESTETVVSAPTSTYVFDKDLPVINEPATTITTPSATLGRFEAGRSNLTYTMSVTDVGSGLNRTEFALVTNDVAAAPARDPSGIAIVIQCWTFNGTCTQGHSVVGTMPGTGSGTAQFTFDRAPLGTFKLRYTAVDNATNAVTQFTPAATLTVYPRFVLLTEPGGPAGSGLSGPSASESGIRMSLLAGFDATSSDFVACEQNACRVSSIEIWGRARGATDKGQQIYSTSIPNRGPSTFLAGSGADSIYRDETRNRYYDYSPVGTIPLPSGLAFDNLEIRAHIVVKTGAAASAKLDWWTPVGTDTNFGGANTWIRVPVVGETPGLQMQFPLVDGSTVFLAPEGRTNPSTTWPAVASRGGVWFSATLEQIGLPATLQPQLNFSILILEDGTPTHTFAPDNAWYFDPTTGAATQTRPTLFANVTTTPLKGPLYYFNWSTNTTFPSGKYVLNISTAGPREVTSAAISRTFAVEGTRPVVTIPTAQTELWPDYDARFVNRTFNLSFAVDHGFAKVTADDLSVTLRSENKATGSAGTHIYRGGDGSGFEYAVKSFAPGAKASSGVVTVTLPANATDQSRYDVFVNVSAQSQSTGRCITVTAVGCRGIGDNRGNATDVRHVILDLGTPSSGVFLADTNATGFVYTNPLKIWGFAEDLGSGIRTVEVRLHDDSFDRTFVWNDLGVGGWRPDLVDSWMSSDLRAPATGAAPLRDVQLFQFENGTTLWSITGGRVPLNRTVNYTVEVRTLDNLTNPGGATSHGVRFDEWAPTVTAGLAFAPATSFTAKNTSWHGGGTFTVSAKDNQCLARVQVFATFDDGSTAGPVDLSKPAGNVCGEPASTWTLDLATAPSLTDRIGRAEYKVVAVDAASLSTWGIETVNLTILDRTPASVGFTYLEPPVVQSGGASRIRAEIFDNQGVANVTAYFYKRLSDGVLVEMARANMTPEAGRVDAKGVGNWTIATSEMNLTGLETGDYVWLIRPVDKNTVVTCADDCLKPGVAIECEPACESKPIPVLARSDAGVSIVLDAPSATAAFINGTPTFRFKVFEKAVTASGITLKAGNSTTNLSVVSPTSVTDLPTLGGQRTGVLVEYRPNVTSSSFAIQLSATSGSSSNQTSVFTFAVDNVAPTVAANVTGTRDIGVKRWAGADTRVTIASNDTHPGSVTYTVNGAGPTAYTGPITPSGQTGPWRLDYTATDAAGNKATGTLTLDLDRRGPVVSLSQNGDEVAVTVDDDGIGLNESTVTIFYAYGAAATFSAQTMEKQAGNIFRIQLTGNASATGLKYYFEARDALGNLGGSTYTAANPFVILPDTIVDDLPPTLRITSPTANQTVRALVDLVWLASDPDGSAVSITIALREPTGSGRILQTAGANNGTWKVDMTGRPEGAYALVVTAISGNQTTQETVNFRVQRGEVIELASQPPVSPQPNKPVAVSIKVNSDKTIASATYTLVRENATVATGAMRGSQGSYTANVLPTEPGKYRVLVSVAYADGTSEAARQVTSFDVASAGPPTPPPTSGALPASVITLIVLSLTTVALAAYAITRWKK